MAKLTLRRKSDSAEALSAAQSAMGLMSSQQVHVCDRHFKSIDERFITHYHHVIPFKAARYSPLPSGLDARLTEYLRTYTSQLYDHQAAALYQLLKRKNVLLSTKTASGKSLVFMTYAIDKLLKVPESRVLVFYPTRALIEDQLLRWQEISSNFGFKAGFLHGQVEREDKIKVLETCQIVLCTPDIIHYWFMPSLHIPAVAKWLTALRFVIIDEAHAFSGVFGTNVSYLLNRVEQFAKSIQYFASTATISGANQFMMELTGKEFVEVGLPEDGSPTYRKDILFVEPADDEAINALLAEVINSNTKFMYFKNSRQGIEFHLAQLLEGDYGSAILPQIKDGFVCTYRGGYESKDRKVIMKSLRLGHLKGVLCTSALEVGLDIGDVDLVIIDDISPSINAFWQRLGRAGRQGPSLVIQILSGNSLLAPADYLKSPLLKPNLYQQLPFFKKWHSDCALQEQVMFKKRAAMVHKLQFRHSFRNMGATFKLGLEINQDLDLGDVDYEQYLNEAFPGAIYRYFGRPHRVGWRNKNFIKCYVTKDISVFREEIMFSLLSPSHLAEGFSSYLTAAQTVRAIIGFSQFNHSFYYSASSSWCKKPIFKLYDSTALVVDVAADRQPNSAQIAELIKVFAIQAAFDKNDVIYHFDDVRSCLIIQAIVPDTGLIEEVLWTQKDMLLGLLAKQLADEEPELVKDTRYYLESHQLDPLKTLLVKGAKYGFYVDEKAGKYVFLPYRCVNEQGYYEIMTGTVASRLISPKYFNQVYEQPSQVIADLMLNGYANVIEPENLLTDITELPDAEVLGQHNGTEHCLADLNL
ncbi:Helicase conserved C-terminal domain-containing protein [Arsukibacterium tuosuense]|uniref:Helicase conserved C-terminal domain-containing protein n=1 Tax=Arsukibacterium tuosuense TaxID=1323745 RepID=A0A285JDQ1_9GAMM|nr:DEAD/DEAH box helicase [Arsukibacterium tuosuense]SNY58420.1 Helicase conserved C-terminal domain-containing protein [Arsukibacterium tuosuense]